MRQEQSLERIMLCVLVSMIRSMKESDQSQLNGEVLSSVLVCCAGTLSLNSTNRKPKVGIGSSAYVFSNQKVINSVENDLL